MRYHSPGNSSSNRGFTLLYAMLVVAAVIGVTSAVAGVLVRELKLSDVRQRSLEAYYAAQSGLECAYSWSLQRTPFDGSTDIECDGVTIVNVGETFSIDGSFCADVTVTPSCETCGSSNPVRIESRGYDTCNSVRRQVERMVFLEHDQLPPPVTETPAPPPGSCVINACSGPDGVTNDVSCGLLGHWPMNGGTVDYASVGQEVRDISGNNRHGNLFGAPSLVSGGGLEFDGSGDYVELGDIDLTGDFTISAWARPDVYSDPNKGIVAKENSYTVKAWYPGINQLAFKLHHPWSEAPLTWETASYSGVSTSVWYHVAGVYNCSTQLGALYVNGLYRSTTPNPTTVNLNNLQTMIARIEPDNDFDGGIANVRIYARALNTIEISALHSLGR